MKELRKLYKRVSDKANVIGYSMKPVPRIKDGNEIPDELVFRVYVSKKVPVSALAKRDIIPKKIKGVFTDVVVIDTVEALAVDRTLKWRPVPLGVSVGHCHITAGSLGMLYTRDGIEYAGTNAHVVTPDVRSAPAKTDICQPGAAHDSSLQVVGFYKWHDPIKSMTDNECPVSNTVVYILNIISKLLGRTSRFQASSPLVVNHQDFGVYNASAEHELSVPDASLDGKDFIGHLFAGSEVVGVICKVEYAIEKGFGPVSFFTTQVSNGDKVEGHSFWGDYTTEVQDTSASIQISYNGFVAMFEDVILVKNEKVIKGGWSGSGWYKVL